MSPVAWCAQCADQPTGRSNRALHSRFAREIVVRNSSSLQEAFSSPIAGRDRTCEPRFARNRTADGQCKAFVHRLNNYAAVVYFQADNVAWLLRFRIPIRIWVYRVRPLEGGRTRGPRFARRNRQFRRCSHFKWFSKIWDFQGSKIQKIDIFGDFWGFLKVGKNLKFLTTGTMFFPGFRLF